VATSSLYQTKFKIYFFPFNLSLQKTILKLNFECDDFERQLFYAFIFHNNAAIDLNLLQFHIGEHLIMYVYV